MKSVPFSIILLSTLAVVSDICSADAMVRINCEEKDVGAKVYINDLYKADCPFDVMIPAGQHKLRAVKTVDTEYEKTFEQELNIFDGVVKRVEIMLSEAKLTASAQQARQLESQRREEQAAQSDLRAAQAGDIKAMDNLAQRYAMGKGLQQNDEQAQAWRHKTEIAKAEAQFRAKLSAARSGNIDAMRSVARRYETGNGVERNYSKAQIWQQKAEAAKQEKINQEIAKREREEAERQRIESANKRAEKKRKLDEFSFFPETQKVFRYKNSPSLSDTFVSPMLLVIDIMSLPSQTTKYQKIKNKLASLPSKWAKPNSMIAKAYRQQKSNNL